ncbi:MAG: two-component regulator propeller domain-containing protein [Vicinamibacterales bacterium]
MLSFLLAAGLATSAAPQDVQPRNGILQEYNLTVWTEREGLRSPRVMAITQTSDGYLWLGTMQGLTRFDGTTFMPWEAIGTTSLPSSRVISLCPNPDGSLWVAYQSGTVANISGTNAVVHDEVGRATGGIINAMITDRQGILWVAARNGLLRVERDHVTRLAAGEGLPDGPVLNSYEDSHGDLWVSSNTGIFRRRLGSTRFDPVMPASYFDHRVTVDSTGAVWITDPRRGFQRMAATDGAGFTATEPGPRAGLGIQVLAGTRGAISGRHARPGGLAHRGSDQAPGHRSAGRR